MSWNSLFFVSLLDSSILKLYWRISWESVCFIYLPVYPESIDETQRCLFRFYVNRLKKTTIANNNSQFNRTFSINVKVEVPILFHDENSFNQFLYLLKQIWIQLKWCENRYRTGIWLAQLWNNIHCLKSQLFGAKLMNSWWINHLYTWLIIKIFINYIFKYSLLKLLGKNPKPRKFPPCTAGKNYLWMVPCFSCFPICYLRFYTLNDLIIIK